MPNLCFASSAIMLGFQGGSQTKSTVASPTPSMARIFSCGVRGDHRAHAAAGRRKRHFDRDLVVIDFHIVNQTEVDDIDRNLRIVAFVQSFVDLFFRHQLCLLLLE